MKSIQRKLTPFKQWEQQTAALKANPEATRRLDRPHHREERPASFSTDLKIIRICLVILVTALIVGILAYTEAVTMPVTMALMLYLLLRPSMQMLEKRNVPPVIGATICLAVIAVLALGIIAYTLKPAQTWVENAPQSMQQLKIKLEGLTERLASMERVSEQFSDAAAGDDDEAGAEAEPVPVEIRQPRLFPGLGVITTSGGLASGLIITFGTLFFLLAYGELMIRNVVSAFRKAETRARAEQLISDLQHGMSYYLFTITVINAFLGVATGTAMWLLGMPNALLIGTMAFLFNYIPFLGAWVGTAVVFVVAVLQFDSFAYALLPPTIYFTLTSLEGQFVTPCVLGRSMSLNPLLVFLSIAVWGWMWGIGGVFLSVPLLAVAKIVADYFPSLHLFSRALMTRPICAANAPSPPEIRVDLEPDTTPARPLSEAAP